jgi:fatty acid-binding protein DegV
MAVSMCAHQSYKQMLTGIPEVSKKQLRKPPSQNMTQLYVQIKSVAIALCLHLSSAISVPVTKEHKATIIPNTKTPSFS